MAFLTLGQRDRPREALSEFPLEVFRRVRGQESSGVTCPTLGRGAPTLSHPETPLPFGVTLPPSGLCTAIPRPMGTQGRKGAWTLADTELV